MIAIQIMCSGIFFFFFLDKEYQNAALINLLVILKVLKTILLHEPSLHITSLISIFIYI